MRGKRKRDWNVTVSSPRKRQRYVTHIIHVLPWEDRSSADCGSCDMDPERTERSRGMIKFSETILKN